MPTKIQTLSKAPTTSSLNEIISRGFSGFGIKGKMGTPDKIQALFISHEASRTGAPIAFKVLDRVFIQDKTTSNPG